MPVKYMKTAFEDYQITHWKDDWKHVQKHITGEKKEYYNVYINNPVDQQVFVTWDISPRSTVPKGCKKNLSTYYMTIYNYPAEDMFLEGTISEQDAYGHLNVASLPSGNYRMEIN
jgi:hypothetical protein